MTALIKNYFYLSRKLLYVIVCTIIFVFILSWLLNGEIKVGSISIYFFLLAPILATSFLLENNFIQTFRIMPISVKDFIKSVFIFGILIEIFVSIPLIGRELYLYVTDQIEFFNFCFNFGMFAAAVAAIGATMTKFFTNPSEKTKSFSFGTIMFYLIALVIPHLIVVLIFSIMGLPLIGCFIMPIVSLIIFYHFYKKSIIHYENAEF
ncbi:hypothetical protein DCE79_04635 [Lysinibacillus sp. 2017]|uniref:hypothetical protein n=1 Tax=unclassified Lysinibacillus TaxID=2636778 RepID=UPI000D526A0B|nr:MULTISPECIES: hypothetical protein [unclassified Lysinibacillus]AWE06724.1 hypothetical protein DCE79_04635 [Lysinibacillus sp. 2017]TGN37343.1 hypothetical protein E4L99_02360 [Lysinibacillus sp. S2017]